MTLLPDLSLDQRLSRDQAYELVDIADMTAC